MLVRTCAVAITVLGLAGAPATAGIFGNAPDVILCPLPPMPSRPGGLVAYHIDGRFDDGTVIYRRLATTATRLFVEDGVVRIENLPGCDGVTVQQLRDDGRAFDYH